MLILAETKKAFEAWTEDSAAQEEAALFSSSRVWLLTDSGIWPRSGANRKKGKNNGMTYFGERDPATGKPNGTGTGFYTNGNKFEGMWTMGKKSGQVSVDGN